MVLQMNIQNRLVPGAVPLAETYYWSAHANEHRLIILFKEATQQGWSIGARVFPLDENRAFIDSAKRDPLSEVKSIWVFPEDQIYVYSDHKRISILAEKMLNRPSIEQSIAAGALEPRAVEDRNGHISCIELFPASPHAALAKLHLGSEEEQKS
jgi:hypothetical protein